MNILKVAHIALTVTDIVRSKKFYQDMVGLKIEVDTSNFVMFSVGDAHLGLKTHSEQLKENRFSEFNVGLDHISFEVPSYQDLENALNFFDKNGIEHGTIKEMGDNGYVLAFRDPDNIQLELFSAKD